MSSLAKLAIAICLAIVAAGINWFWLTSQATPPTYVAVNTTVDKNAEIADDFLRPVPIPGKVEKLRETLIPYENRSILFGMSSPRRYEDGDLIFQRDIQLVSQKVQLPP